jgi:anti-sigma-K factor RskA
VEEMKKKENDWYQTNFWRILMIVLFVIGIIIIIAAVLVTLWLSIGLVAVIFGFYVVFGVRKLTQKGK